jgi:hypothetical protein
MPADQASGDGGGPAIEDPLTGLSEPGVRAAVERLGDAEGRSPEDAVEVYDDVHRRLGAVLAGEGAPAPGGPPRP